MYLWVPLPAGVASLDFQERLMQEEGVVAGIHMHPFARSAQHAGARLSIRRFG